ncbi:MAG: VOC family protein [Bacteroidales bacterium]
MDNTFVTIGVKNIVASTAFYKKVLGYEVAHEVKPAEHTHLVWIARKESLTIELVYQEQSGSFNNEPGSVMLTYVVADLSEYNHKLNKLGIPYQQVALGPGTEALRFQDPDGITISVVAHN